MNNAFLLSIGLLVGSSALAVHIPREKVLQRASRMLVSYLDRNFKSLMSSSEERVKILSAFSRLEVEARKARVIQCDNRRRLDKICMESIKEVKPYLKALRARDHNKYGDVVARFWVKWDLKKADSMLIRGKKEREEMAACSRAIGSLDLTLKQARAAREILEERVPATSCLDTLYHDKHLS